ncbi:MAG: nucleoside phosphorylase [Eubacteriales bacterium]|nr:nucleoside phosphorylase [Eubacteriales bacterium]
MLDKSKITQNTKQYHIAVGPGEIGRYVLLPGDPARCDMVAKYLENASLVAFHREHKTYTGFYKGVKISVTSTGMGCPSAAIAAEELIHIGAEVLIRIGSCGAITDKAQIGDLMITTAAMKNEGTSKFYVPECFPAVADFSLTELLLSTANKHSQGNGWQVHYGITATDDAFYGESPEWISSLHALKVMNVDMESSALFTIGHLREVHTATINAVSGNLTNADVIYTERNIGLEDGWDNEIKVALETIVCWDELRKDRN